METKDDEILTIIIEHPGVFYDIVSDISSQTDGMSGNFVISENYETISIYKNAEIITRFVPFSANSKELLNKVYTFLAREAMSETMIRQTYDLMSRIESYIYELTRNVSAELNIDSTNDISGLLKMFNVSFSDSEMPLPERLIEYMDAVCEFIKKKVFITVNLRSYINDDQAELFFKDVLLRNITFICIENCEHNNTRYEKRVIIDNDRCVI